MNLGLVRRRQCLVPTWRGWLLLIMSGAGLTLLGGWRIHPFLAVSDPKPGGVLVVEGWAPDYALAAAAEEFKRNHYDKLYVTGGPMEWGAALSEYKTYGEVGAATLLRMGLSTNEVQAVPAPAVVRDRSYAAAAALRKWLEAHGPSATQCHLMSMGPHARRSRLVFEKALGQGVRVAVTAIPIKDYDAKRWWRSSQGVRTVIGETVAYGYARLFFRTPENIGTME